MLLVSFALITSTCHYLHCPSLRLLSNGLLQFSPVDLPTARLSLLRSVQLLQLDCLIDFLVPPTSLPSCVTIFIGYHSSFGFHSRFSQCLLVKLPGTLYVYLRNLIRLPPSAPFLHPQRSLSWHDIFVPRATTTMTVCLPACLTD